MDKVLTFIKGISPTTWIIIAIVVILIIAAIIYFNDKPKEDGTVQMNATLTDNLSTTPPRSVFPLQLGSNNPQVGIVQKYVKAKGQFIGNTGPNKDGVDNVWGPLTDTAVKKVLGVSTISEDLFKTLV